MAEEFRPHLDAAVRRRGPGRRPDTLALARYVVALIEGSIMLTRTRQDPEMIVRHLEYLKEHLRRSLGTDHS